MIQENEWSNIRYELERSDSISNLKKIAVWLALDCPEPPPSAYKQELIKLYEMTYSYKGFVETGTYYGQMVAAVQPFFEQVHTVELSLELYQLAEKKFNNVGNIRVYQGDSGKVLPNILRRLRGPAIFWLDAHYSAGETAKGDLETPIIKELESILSHKSSGHIILIDDARLFDGTNDYPTLETIKKFISKQNKNLSMVVRHDIIRICPVETDIEI